MKRYYTLWRVSHSTQVLRRTSARICSTPKLKFVGLSSYTAPGSQLLNDVGEVSRLGLQRGDLLLGVLALVAVHELLVASRRLLILVRLAARAQRGGAPIPPWESVRC